jgi:hypothetical protein
MSIKGGENNKEAWCILDWPAGLLRRKTNKVIHHQEAETRNICTVLNFLFVLRAVFICPYTSFCYNFSFFSFLIFSFFL